MLNMTIAEHMYRSGNFQAGEIFTTEANVDISEEFKSQFKELN